MNPLSFPQANVLMKRPPSMTAEQCADLPVCLTKDPNGSPVVVSCWQVTDDELKQLKKTRKLYLGVMGSGMPPVFLTAEDPFSPIIQPAEQPPSPLKLIKP